MYHTTIIPTQSSTNNPPHTQHTSISPTLPKLQNRLHLGPWPLGHTGKRIGGPIPKKYTFMISTLQFQYTLRHKQSLQEISHPNLDRSLHRKHQHPLFLHTSTGNSTITLHAQPSYPSADFVLTTTVYLLL